LEVAPVSFAACMVTRRRWHDGVRLCSDSGLPALAIGSRHEHLRTTRKMRRKREGAEQHWVTLATVISSTAALQRCRAVVETRFTPYLGSNGAANRSVRWSGARRVYEHERFENAAVRAALRGDKVRGDDGEPDVAFANSRASEGESE
jgi:hypothetical protein